MNVWMLDVIHRRVYVEKKREDWFNFSGPMVIELLTEVEIVNTHE
jgi:hypothetical protein